jgi:HEAT repeat protein
VKRSVACGLCSVLVLCGWAVRPAQAHPGRVAGQLRPHTNASQEEDSDQARVGERTLRGRSGVSMAKRLLDSELQEDRIRGLRRLGTVGTRQALQVLIEWVDASTEGNSQARLVAVRALARHARRSAVTQALVRMMTGVGTSPTHLDPLEQSIRSSAALALAASGSPTALAALAKAVRHEGPTAQAAAAALEAYPPRDLRPVVQARGAPTRVLVRLLARLGDQRAFYPLRSFVRWATPAVRADAAVALTELGDLETVELARHWLKHERQPTLRVAAARILALTRASDAPRVIAALLRDDATRNAGLELALQAPHPAHVPALEALLADADDTEVGHLLAAIGRAGGERAARLLARELRSPKRAAPAAYALALTAGGDAGLRLAEALGQPTTRRLAARAAVVRALVLGEPVGGAVQTLEHLLASHSAADRASGAWGLAASDPDWARRLLAHTDPVVVRASARAALSAGVSQLAARRLVSERDGPTRTALGIALAASEGADELPTRVLIELLEQGGAVAPLAARALAARDCPELRPRVQALLLNADAQLRGHAALGLGRSQDPSAIGLLESTYRFEPDPNVRHAVVTALSRRRESTRRRILRLAAGLDGDRRVREAARLALAGRSLDELVVGPTAFWLSVEPNSGEKAAGGEQQAAVVQTCTGLALPLLADPDGLVVTTGLPAGSVRLRLMVAEGYAPAR